MRLPVTDGFTNAQCVTYNEVSNQWEKIEGHRESAVGVDTGEISWASDIDCKATES